MSGSTQHVRHRRRNFGSQRRSDPDRRHSPPRIPRLRLDRTRRRQRRREPDRSSGSCRRRAWPISPRRPTRCTSRRPPASRIRAGPRTARRRRTTRIRIFRAARSPSCTTASSRTTRSCASELKARGYVFRTQTDTEVIAHLIHSHWHAEGGGDLLCAVQRAIAEFQRRVRDRRDLDARARARHRRAAGQPAARRHRRRTIISSRPTRRR